MALVGFFLSKHFKELPFLRDHGKLEENAGD
jgi:hypothetical protein